jgi:hypothetical protein
MSVVTSNGFTKEYDKRIHSIMFGTYAKAEIEYDKLFNSVPAADGKEYRESQLSGLGSFDQIAEGQTVPYSVPTEGNEKARTYKKFGLGFQITEEAKEDDVHGNWAKMPAELAKSAVYKIETEAWDILNSGFATHLAIDGQYVFDASGRTILGTGVAQNNRPSTDAALSETSLQAAHEYFFALKDFSGRPITMSLDDLWIPKEEMWNARALLKSPLKPGSMDNDINTLKDYATINLHVGRYLTSTTAWFAFSRDWDGRIMWKRKLKLQSADDFGTGSALYKATMRFVPFCNDPIGGYATTGA